MKTILIFILISTHTVKAGNNASDLIFKAGFETIVKLLNDTGVIFGGNYPSGNNIACSSNIASQQDCHVGADSVFDPDDNGIGGFNFTKLDANGNPLASTAASWSCVQDNITQLVWEVKTTAPGIHNKDNTYQWGGLTAIGRNHPNAQGTYADDWNGLVQGTNNESLCGFNDWRVPTPSELTSITFKSSYTLSIDGDFFPYTQVSVPYWSASPVAGNASKAWSINFQAGFDLDNFRTASYAVRLVRSN